MLFPRLRRPDAPVVALAVTLALTAFAGRLVWTMAEARDQLRFERVVDDTFQRIHTRLDMYVELLRSGAALFTASEEVTEPEFRAFVEQLALRERYPGIQGIGFSKVLTPEARLEFEARQQADRPWFHVWPTTPRAEYHTIAYLEPLDRRNRAAIGYDMFTEPVRRAAMTRARDTGEPAASGRVTLVQEIDVTKQAGFLIYVAVYRRGVPLGTPEERRRSLVGFVYAPFRADDLLEGILGEQSTAAVALKIYDGPKGISTLLHDAGGVVGHGSFPAHPHRVSRTMNVSGRPWRMVFTSLPAFDEQAPWRSTLLTLGIGAALSLALFLVLSTQQQKLRESREHAAALARSEEALRLREGQLRDVLARERDARDRAESADRAKDEFLATLSHELRTPLNAVIGWASMLKAGKVRDAKRAEAIEVIVRNARVQQRLIEDLLDVSRMASGKLRLERRAVPVAPVLRETIDALRPSADARGVALDARIPPDIGAVLGDASRLQQIVWNLASNAIKFTNAGGHVTIGASTADGQVHITVCDTGIGISPEFLPHVFERFRQADSSTTRQYGGVGLGLAIARNLAELQGGSIEARSEGIGRGATFVVHLAAAPHAP